jgi:hypothetical protein
MLSCRFWFLLRFAQAAFTTCVIIKALQALNEVPAVRIITMALSSSLVPLLELLLVTCILIALMAMLLVLRSNSDERLTTVPLISSYIFGGIITGMSSNSHALVGAMTFCLSRMIV